MASSFGSIRRPHERIVWQTVLYLIMLAISVATVVPFLFMASTSFTEAFTMMTYPPTLIPKDPSFDNYREIIFEFQG